jgi:octaprenyl-diphosphate synthase
MTEALKHTKKPSAGPLKRAQEMLSAPLVEMEAQLDEVVQSTVRLIPEVSTHLIGAGGKRIRPTLLLLMARATGADAARGVDLAVATELIHNATLLHDDVVDRGHLRRGVRSAPVVYGNSASVLVGDFMMARAFSLVTRHGNLSLLKELSRVVSAMAEGEVLQLVRSSRITLSMPNYEEIISGKTAGLFSWSCLAGASLKGEPDQVQAASGFGQSFGMAFQIADDVLDYTASPEESGKDLANDLTQGKMTLPLLLACEEDPDLLGAAEAQAVGEPRQEECMKIVERVLQTRAVTRALDKAWSFVEQARQSLGNLPDGPARRSLLELAEFVVARVSVTPTA